MQSLFKNFFERNSKFYKDHGVRVFAMWRVWEVGVGGGAGVGWGLCSEILCI